MSAQPSKILGPDGRPAQRLKVRGWQEAYEAADRRDFRGYFYMPTLDPAKLAPEPTRAAIHERIDWLYKNVSAVGMVIDGLAIDEVGTGLWPNWASSNPDFNAAMTDLFHFAVHDPRIFSADGESDYYTAQINVRRMIRLYGDGFGQLLRPSPGSIHPQCHLLPGWRVSGKPKGAGKNSGWGKDGTRRNRLGRAVQYFVPDEEAQKQATREDEGVPGMVVEADDMLHFHDPFLPGQSRGVSCLASVAKRLFRREDIFKALANGTLARERVGFALEVSPDDETGGPSASEFAGEGDGEGAADNGGQERADGTTYEKMRLFGTDAAEEILVPKLLAGTKLSTVESNRPGTAVTEFLDLILREVAWAAKRSPEYVFFLAQLGQGTVARIVLGRENDLIRVVRSTQLIPQFCHRWPVFHAWQLIKSGAFDGIKDGVPADWWKHEDQADKDKSVDLGREGRLLDEREATGRLSTDDYHALGGRATADVDKSNFARRKARLEQLVAFNEETKAMREKLEMPPITYDQMWPRTAQQQQPAAEAKPGGAEE